MAARPVLLAIVSDIHIKSTLALCPPEGVMLDDGGRYLPSKAQSWIWDCWEDYWRKVAALQRERKAKLVCIYNGDLFDGGAHHGTTQTITDHKEPDEYIADRAFGVPLALNPSQAYIVRGTEAHVGPSAQSEEAFGKHLGAYQDPETKRRSFWHLRLEVHGIRLDCQHHTNTGGALPWTGPQGAQRAAFRVWSEHNLHGDPAPHLAIRSHTHVHRDSGDPYPTRLIVTPAWQLKTSYAHAKATDSLADIGGLVIMVEPDGRYQVAKHIYKVELPPLVRVA